jgi:hypothetical protein
VLCASLTYEQGPPAVLRGEEVQEYTRRYAPPFDEFEVQRVEVPAGASTLLPANPVRRRARASLREQRRMPPVLGCSPMRAGACTRTSARRAGAAAPWPASMHDRSRRPLRKCRAAGCGRAVPAAGRRVGRTAHWCAWAAA